MRRMRLYGLAVSDVNCRLLITSLIAEGTSETREIAGRISAGITHQNGATALKPAERDALLRSIPKPPPSGLVPLRDALTHDQRARK